MKGFFSRVTVMLALLLFTATAAVADDFGQQVLAGSQNQTVASDDDTEPIKIVYENTGFEVCSMPVYSSTNIVQYVDAGSLTQTVIAGDYIEPTVIRYENTGFSESECPEITWSSTDFYNNFGLSKNWTKGPACTISGRMRSDIPAGTYNAYIVVHDIDNNFFKTEFTFIVKELLFYNPGDANGDGDITMADANMVVNYFLAADKSQVSNINLSAADVNNDGNITMADANQIVNMFLSNGK